MSEPTTDAQSKPRVSVTPGMLVRRFSAFAATGYGAIVLALFVMQDFMIFPGGGPLHRTPEDLGWEYLTVTRDVMDHQTVGWYMPVANARGTVLYSHGNGENISDGLDQAAIFRSMGLNCLMYDYGGYGDSSGKPSEPRCYADARAMWDWLIAMQGAQPADIVLAGRSLGGGVAAQLATEVTPAGVILESTFTSLPHVAQSQFAWLPAGLLVRHKFNNAEKVSGIEAPILIVHSRDDTLIPFEQGRALYETAREPKEFLAINGGHNNAHVQSRTDYMQALTTFFDRVFGPADETDAA